MIPDDDVLDKTTTEYRRALIMALRLRDVPGARIGEVVAEVESHVAESGEDPREAFGSARDYATSLTFERRPDPWWQLALIALFAAIAGWLVAEGAFALLLGETHLGQQGWVWLVLGLLVAIPVGISVQRRSSSVRDPRTGADMVPLSRWQILLLGGVPIGIILIGWAVIELADVFA